MIIGSGGVFEVRVDDELVVEMKSWRFPTAPEVVAAVSKALNK